MFLKGVHVESGAASARPLIFRPMKKIIEVENLKCGGCATTISNKLFQIAGVQGVDVISATKNVILTYTGSEETYEAVMSKLKKLGYPQKGEPTTLDAVKSYASSMIGRVSKPVKPASS
jgi:copper chaperone